MNASELINAADFDGVRLALTADGGLHYSGNPEMVKEWLPILREHKAEIVNELHRERRHAKVLKMLGNRKYAVLVEDETTNPVIATCAIAGLATFELAIPRHSYNGLVLMELLEKHSTEPRAEPSQSSGNTNRRQEQPGRRTA
jgi:hypothetical protein